MYNWGTRCITTLSLRWGKDELNWKGRRQDKIETSLLSFTWMEKQEGVVRAEGKKRQGVSNQAEGYKGEVQTLWPMQMPKIYKVFISLRAWSSSSLIALYFSFWVYSSSAGGGADKKQVESEERAELCRRQEEKEGKRWGKLRTSKIWTKVEWRDWKEELKRSVPSKSSMVFSSLAAVLSANSARVSALKENTILIIQMEISFSLRTESEQTWTYLLESVAEDFYLLLIFVFFLRVLQRQRNMGRMSFNCQNNSFRALHLGGKLYNS